MQIKGEEGGLEALMRDSLLYAMNMLFFITKSHVISAVLQAYTVVERTDLNICSCTHIKQCLKITMIDKERMFDSHISDNHLQLQSVTENFWNQ